MARLRDFPHVISNTGLWEFTKRVWREVGEDEVLVWGAAMAYSWLFAIFPFFIFLLTLLPYLPQRWKIEVEAPLSSVVHRALPAQAADAVWPNLQRLVHSLLNKQHTGLLSTGVAITLWAASGGMSTTMSALERCYDVPRSRSFFIQRPLAILLTILVAILIVAVLVLLPVGSAVTHALREQHIRGISGLELIVWDIARHVLAFFLLLIVLALLYYFGPGVKQPFRLFTPGSVFTLAVWILLEFSFRLYLRRWGKYDQTYGTLGGVAILLLFFYVDAVVLLIGAEINTEIDFELGVPRGSYDFRGVTPIADESDAE